MASIAAMLMIAPSDAAVCIVDTRQHQGPDGEQHRGEDDRAPLPWRPGELGFPREVTFDLIELALFVLGQRHGLLPKPLDSSILRLPIRTSRRSRRDHLAYA